MASWIVMEPPRGTPAPDDRDIAFIRDGFSFLAFLFPPLWLLWHRLWIETALAFAALLLAGGLERVTGFAFAAPFLSLIVSIFVGLEGNGLRIAALRRRGWNFVTVIEADDLYDAETRYAADADEDGDGIPDRFQITPSPGPTGAMPAAPVGLLLNPGN
jgi:hypothetical protein